MRHYFNKKSLLFKDYNKSNLTSNNLDGGFFYPKKETEYLNRDYETLKDSKGNEHIVCVESKLINYEFKDDDFRLSTCDNFFHHEFLKVKTGVFQYNLKLYQIVLHPERDSIYNEVYRLCSDYDHNGLNYNYSSKHYLLNEYDYFPLYENCFTSGNNTEINNYISDSFLFKIKDRQYLYNRVNWDTKRRLNKINFLKMSDLKYEKFLIKRLDDKSKFVKKYNELFNKNH